MRQLLVGILILILDASVSRAAVFVIADGDVAALKSAINVANANGEDDTIELAANGSYILTEVDANYIGLPAITSDAGRELVIHGNGATIQCVTADGATPFGVFGVGGDAHVSIFALTIRQSSAAAGYVLGGGVLSVEGCVFAQNRGEDSGALTNSGSLTVTDTTFTENTGVFGGAIGTFGGGVIVKRCTFTGNVASDGGAIYVSALDAPDALTVQSSTFTLNSAGDIGGGAIYLEAQNHNAVLNLSSSTFDRNSVPNESGGALGVGGALCILASKFSQVTTLIMNCTFAGNSGYEGGAIFDDSHGDGDSFSDIWLINCTLSENTAFFAGAFYDEAPRTASNLRIGNTIVKAGAANKTFFGPAISSLGHNVCSDSGDGFLNGPGDQVNTDPQLDSAGLQNNGGNTPTIGLQSTSPAINDGDDSIAPHRDQRGYFRNGVVDIGAFEYQGGLVGPFTQIVRTGTDIMPTCEAVAGYTYHLRRKLNLTDASWQDIPSVSDIVATGDTITFSDPNPLGDGRRFYQVTLIQ